MKTALACVASAFLSACLLPPAPSATRTPAAATLGAAPARPDERPGPQKSLALLAGGDVTLGFHFEELFEDRLAQGDAPERLLRYPFEGLRDAVE
jgi:hypothetical protein